MVAMTVDCLLASGLKRFQVEIGQADFFRGLMEEALIDEQEAEELRLLIEGAIDGVISGLRTKVLPSRSKNLYISLLETVPRSSLSRIKICSVSKKLFRGKSCRTV